MRLQAAAILLLNSSVIATAASLTSNYPESPQLLDALCAARTDGRSNCEVELDVPSSCVPSGTDDPSCPIVFFFHGAGGTNNWFKSTAGVHDNNFIGIYPQGENGWNTGPKDTNNCAWDDFDCSTDPDEGDLMASIISEVRSLGGTGRIYAIGNSNGAALAHRLAANAGDALPLSGIVTKVTQLMESPTRNGPGVLNYNQPGTNGSGSTRKVSVLNIMGTSDSVIPYEGGTAGVLGGNDPNFVLMHAHISMETWAAHNGCSVTPTTTSTHATDVGTGVAAFYGYANCADGHIVEHFAIEGGGHSVGNAEIDGTNIDYDLVYDFIRRVEAGLDGGGGPPSPSTPGPTTTVATTAAPPSCSDDPAWYGKNSVDHNCDFVALSPDFRCTWESTTGTLASDACLETCSNCSATTTATSTTSSDVSTSTSVATTATLPSCSDDPAWHGKNSVDHNCDFVALNPSFRCTWENSDGTLASDACLETCSNCPATTTTLATTTTSEASTSTTVATTAALPSCSDDPAWHGKNSVDHNCDFVALNPGFRCTWESTDGTLASDACAETCSNCPV